MNISDEKLRADRLVFYSRDVERLDEELDSFLELSNARCALLIDCEGHLVTRRGEAAQDSVESLSALTAGSFAATRQMAQMMGESQFNSLFHQGAQQSIQVSLVGNRTLLAIIWDGRTNLGLVRFYATETVKRLSEIFDDIGRRAPSVPTESLSGSFGAEASAALDDLF
ncbi:MAG: roadblock/LC7 domain-containing protein [Planctomycetes bacterium]|nr:roadblock/LC7 domain-containing protein [Planctomycetota bacterium]MCB9911022.1 roadblock/LC7 domain-containing protein [Planctomycetota bacterium]HPF14640.1 roadblock/LC7 domain-containing protein [Planctomycetota bacterium]HRV81932.1 roadblock/LC7 domain-containing protein [Planctomycetota bacterium]